MRLLAVAVSTRKERVIARTGLLLLASILFVGGWIVFWQQVVDPLTDVWRSRDWPQVPVRIEAVQLVAGVKGYQLEVRYRYRFADRVYQSERYGLYHGYADPSTLEAVYAELLYTKRMFAWVNPKNPEEALLNRDFSWPTVFLAIPACGMIFLGALLFWAAFVSARDFLRSRGWSFRTGESPAGRQE